eukprot:gnl/TRDRNA2_/TRDRNA2_153574_c0_seq2.p1 gnl/TRDRNA2_/TRDRNA2_153574_c0~~gnl/TRDRNA2_/TRDRNA2_153574_c0_seq2.p1  ORF type:complete len:208 (+),score=59.94 gnl/TRDRNA2_/TRDRNA2_153574_c0_seq2:73-624(+)
MSQAAYQKAYQKAIERFDGEIDKQKFKEALQGMERCYGMICKKVLEEAKAELAIGQPITKSMFDQLMLPVGQPDDELMLMVDLTNVASEFGDLASMQKRLGPKGAIERVVQEVGSADWETITVKEHMDALKSYTVPCSIAECDEQSSGNVERQVVSSPKKKVISSPKKKAFKSKAAAKKRNKP